MLLVTMCMVFRTRLVLDQVAESHEYINQALVCCIQTLYELGAARWLTVHAVLVTKTRWRRLRSCLCAAWEKADPMKPTKDRRPPPIGQKERNKERQKHRHKES